MQESLFSWLKTTVSVALLLSLLTACKVELYSKVEEQEGNEMLALLLDHNISSEKRPEKDNMVSLHVEQRQISEAVEILRKSGYPKSKFSTIGDVFSTDKLISTPFEDRTRYIYGLSQEIAKTLSQLDGVMIARVHVVMPKDDRSAGADTEPASAAVFIKHNPNYNFEAYVPQIKSIVSSGIAGLSYNAVSVALFPAQEEDKVLFDTEHRFQSFLSIEVAPSSMQRLQLLLAAFALLVAFLMATSIYFFTRGGHSSSARADKKA